MQARNSAYKKWILSRLSNSCLGELSKQKENASESITSTFQTEQRKQQCEQCKQQCNSPEPLEILVKYTSR